MSGHASPWSRESLRSRRSWGLARDDIGCAPEPQRLPRRVIEGAGRLRFVRQKNTGFLRRGSLKLAHIFHCEEHFCGWVADFRSLGIEPVFCRWSRLSAMLLPRASHTGGDPLRLQWLRNLPPAYSLWLCGWRCFKLYHVPMLAHFSLPRVVLTFRNPPWLRSFFLSLSLFSITRVNFRYDHQFLCAQWPEYHDWIGHLHIRHQLVQFSNISRTQRCSDKPVNCLRALIYHKRGASVKRWAPFKNCKRYRGYTLENLPTAGRPSPKLWHAATFGVAFWTTQFINKHATWYIVPRHTPNSAVCRGSSEPNKYFESTHTILVKERKWS